MQYYYLKSGLPVLGTAGLSAEANLDSIRVFIESNLSPGDQAHFRYLLYRNDNKNLLRLMRAHDGVEESSHLTFNEPAVFAHQELESGFSGISELPEYMKVFVAEYRAGRLPPNVRVRENMLKESYYSEALDLPNAFLRSYFHFKRDLKNILSAINARKFGYPLEEVFIGDYDLVETLRTSRASDFGLARSHPYVSELGGLIESGDLSGLERAIDRILIDHVDEQSAGEPFGSAAVFAYFVRLSLGSRWLSLTKEGGMVELRNIMQRILARASWPTEYAEDERFAFSQERYQ